MNEDRLVEILLLEALVPAMRGLGVLEAFGVRLDPNWQPPVEEKPPITIDPDPQANALAYAALRSRDNLERELKARAADDTVTFAHVNGVPE